MFSIQPYQNRDEIEGINVCVCGACQDNARGYASRSHVCEHGCDSFLIAQSLHDCVDGLHREHVHAHALSIHECVGGCGAPSSEARYQGP